MSTTKSTANTITFHGIGMFHRTISAVSLAASDDKARAHLNSVLFRVQDGQLDVVATDGHMLAIYRRKVDKEEIHMTECITVEGGDVFFLVRMADIKKALRDTRKADDISISNASVITIAGVIFKPVDAQFPPYEQVIPTKGRAILETDGGVNVARGIGLGCELTERVAKIFRRFESKNTGIGMFADFGESELDPIAWSSGSVPELLVIQMPMRGVPGPMRHVVPKKLPANPKATKADKSDSRVPAIEVK